MRGEDHTQRLAVDFNLETPPRAGGRPARFPSVPGCRRNTPTYVGRPDRRCRFTGVVRNTPTCVGKTAASRADFPAWQKHPPHAWGRPPPRSPASRRYRNTPTCVEKTGKTKNDPPLFRKHPHMRGEDIRTSDQPLRRRETPPHAWGRHSQKRFYFWFRRNTPTCVGKTPTSC